MFFLFFPFLYFFLNIPSECFSLTCPISANSLLIYITQIRNMGVILELSFLFFSVCNQSPSPAGLAYNAFITSMFFITLTTTFLSLLVSSFCSFVVVVFFKFWRPCSFVFQYLLGEKVDLPSHLSFYNFILKLDQPKQILFGQHLFPVHNQRIFLMLL